MPDHKHRILVVEDEASILLGLKENLEVAGYEVLTATDGPSALKLGVEARPALILLDVMLPGMSGYEVCRKLREQGLQMAIVMLTARQEEFDKLHGFEMGADDYVTKPFSVGELLARVKAILLRGGRQQAGPRVYEFDVFLLDLEERVLKKKGPGSRVQGSGKKMQRARDAGPVIAAEGDRWEEIVLTRTEFDLLAYFCANEGKALSRERLMNDVWGTGYFGTQRSLDSFVASLRSKIEKKPGEPTHILTVHGVGYKFVGKEEQRT
jgi:DNA-binding response OmpR family regulator